jgi:hypothetical protein
MKYFIVICTCGHSFALTKKLLSLNPSAVVTCKGLHHVSKEPCGRQYQASELIKIAERTDIYEAKPEHPQLDLNQ